MAEDFAGVSMDDSDVEVVDERDDGLLFVPFSRDLGEYVWYKSAVRASQRADATSDA